MKKNHMHTNIHIWFLLLLRRSKKIARQGAGAGRPHRKLRELLPITIVINHAGEIQRLALVPQQDAPLPQPSVSKITVAAFVVRELVIRVHFLLLFEGDGLVAERQEEVLGAFGLGQRRFWGVCGHFLGGPRALRPEGAYGVNQGDSRTTTTAPAAFGWGGGGLSMGWGAQRC